METHTAFFYGTLMAPEILSRVIHGRPQTRKSNSTPTHTFRPALLESYRRHRVSGADYPAIIPHHDSSVRGSLVTNLTDTDIYRLDIFEGDQYVRRKVKVKVLKGVQLNEAAPETLGKAGDGPLGSEKESPNTAVQKDEEVEAETYIWREDSRLLDSREWDFEAFKKDKMRAWMGEAVNGEDNGVKVDEGFEDVDRVVAAEQEREREQGQGWKDPTGGRGANGFITRQLEEVGG